MGRPPCCEESGVKKGPWTPEEDEKLFNYISKHGSGNWKSVPKHAGLNRCGKSCRLRWTNYLRPDIKRGKFTEQDEQLIINLHSVLGNKWSKIATHLPGRTDNEIKNFWNTNLRKKLLQMGIDPETHKPRTDFNHLLNLVQLLGRPNNNNLMMSHAGLVGLLQQPDLSNQLAQIQLLQNLLQLINSNSSFVNNMQSNVLPLFGNHSLINNPMEAADTNGISPSESGHDISGLSEQQALGVNNSISRTTSRDISEAESLLPMFDSTTFHQMDISPIADEVRSTKSTNSSTIFDSDWEKYLEDPDTSDDSFWKELLNLPSPSASPIS